MSDAYNNVLPPLPLTLWATVVMFLLLLILRTPQYIRCVCVYFNRKCVWEILKMRNMSFIFTHTSTVSDALHAFMDFQMSM